MLPPHAVIGMVHVGALPGTPGQRASLGELLRQAESETKILRETGFDGLIVENMHDVPYVNGPHGPEIVASMTRLVHAVRESAGAMQVGVQVLSRGEREALAIAHACGAQFVRCENFVFGHVADEGLMHEAAAGPLLRERRRIGAGHVKIFADLQKKHASHSITDDLSMKDWVHGAEFFGADGVIVTGVATGQGVDESDLAQARHATKLPVWVGSGATPANAGMLMKYADAIIVGSYIKRGGVWHESVDEARCREFVKSARGATGR